MNLIARQMGKTAVSAGYILWNAMFTADQNIVVGGNKLATAKEIIHRVLYGYDNCPDFLKEKLLVRNKMELGFANGSNIYAQTVNPCMGRGHSISLLYLDEFSYVNSADAKQAWQSIRPSLSASSQVIINSSANEQDNFFTTMWEEACNGETKFVTMNIDWKRHPAHDQNWAYEMVACMGVDRFKIEYENRLAA
jgi:phage FluMu gp28-like protein